MHSARRRQVPREAVGRLGLTWDRRRVATAQADQKTSLLHESKWTTTNGGHDHSVCCQRPNGYSRQASSPSSPSVASQSPSAAPRDTRQNKPHWDRRGCRQPGNRPRPTKAGSVPTQRLRERNPLWRPSRVRCNRFRGRAGFRSGTQRKRGGSCRAKTGRSHEIGRGSDRQRGGRVRYRRKRRWYGDLM